jgi:hypothetical protein
LFERGFEVLVGAVFEAGNQYPHWRGHNFRAFLIINSLPVVYDPEHAHPTNLLVSCQL